MASLRTRKRGDGSTSWSVLYTINGRQTSVTFDSEEDASKFKILVDTLGAERAMSAWGIADTPKAASGGLTLVQWLTRYVDHKTGCEQLTLDHYQRYTRQVSEFFGDLPLAAITSEDVSNWIKSLEAIGNKPKTIANKHGFLSSALSAAVPTHIPANPTAGRRLPRGTGDDDEIRMLTKDEFARLLAGTEESWRPLMEFLVVSGCRWGEAAALKPGDVDREDCSVKIRRAWKRSSKGYTIGATKTKRSRRTIKIPKRILDQLDYGNEYLFTNRRGGPVRYMNFRRDVFDRAVAAADLDPPPTPHDLRHTCASWMLNGGVPSSVVSRHLGHESIKITHDIYGDVDQASAQLAADFMDSATAG
jgi:integrase